MTSEMTNAEIPVVILCGGLGTRIRDVTESVPKPLIDVGGKPMLWHIMKLYDHYGFRRFVLCLGYRSADIKDYFLRYREHVADFTVQLKGDHEVVFHNDAGNEDWEITCVETGLHTGTGGRIGRVRSYVDTPTFMLTYGDGLGSVPIDELLAHHRSVGRIGTVTGVHPTSRYGEMLVRGDAVTEFNEKPTVAEGFVSGGFFAFQSTFFDYLSTDESLFLEAEPLRRLAQDQQLAIFRHEGFWVGMDTYREYSLLNDLWTSGEAPWKLWAE